MNPLTYDEFKKNIEKNKCFSIDDASNVIRNFNQYDDEDVRDKLEKIALLFTDPELQILGDDNDYHNLSVEYARQGLKNEAIYILQRGLKNTPYSPDLLADELLYGKEIGLFDICQEADKALSKIERSSWSWRAYSFSIEYYQSEIKRYPKGKKRDALRAKAKELCNAFIEYSKIFPEDAADKAYLRKAMFIKDFGNEFGDSDSAQEVLEKGCSLEGIYSAPQCSLRLADMFFDRGDYDNALKYVYLCVPAANKPQPEVNPQYVFLLKGLIRKAILLNTAKDGNYSDYTEEIQGIYNDFHTVLDLEGFANSPFKRTAQENITVLKRQTAIKDNESNTSLTEDEFV